MSTTPYFPFYPADYLADTAHLTTEQHGAYLLLLMTAWARGGRLPADPKKLARIARVSARRWRLIAEEVLEYFEEDGDEIVSRRMEREHQKAVSKSEKRSASGKRGGIAKALKAKERTLANATRSPCHSPEPYVSLAGDTAHVCEPEREGVSIDLKALAEQIEEHYPRRGLTNSPIQGLLPAIGRAAIEVGGAAQLVAAIRAYATAVKRDDTLPTGLRKFLNPHEGFLDRYAPKAASADQRAIAWRSFCAKCRRSGDWEGEGPPPGQPGCLVPPEIQREYGFEPRPFDAEQRGAA